MPIQFDADGVRLPDDKPAKGKVEQSHKNETKDEKPPAPSDDKPAKGK